MLPAFAFHPSPLADVFAGASRTERGAVQSLRWGARTAVCPVANKPSPAT